VGKGAVLGYIIMNINDITDYLAKLKPIEKIPINWDSKAYTSDSFNKWASGPSFSGWSNKKRTKIEVATIAKLFKIKRGDTLLDVACGYGRHALIFAEKYGLKVTGIDISQGLITTAKRLAREKGLNIKYEVRHAVDLPWSNKFDYAMIAFNTLSLFSPEDAPKVLQGIHRALKQGGRLFLDLDNKPYNCRYGTYDTHWYMWPSGLTLQELYFHEDISTEINRDIIFTPNDGIDDSFIIFKRIYAASEIKKLLKGCGFQVEQIYGNWDLAPLKKASPKMIITGVKK
jgi:ubiquinone/menaquinone biosynthesis C-methylase UbiE